MGGNFPSVIAMQIIPAAAPGFNIFPDCLAWSHISQVDVAARPKWLLLWSQHFHISLKDRLETSVQLLCSAPPGQGTHRFWGLQEPLVRGGGRNGPGVPRDALSLGNTYGCGFPRPLTPANLMFLTQRLPPSGAAVRNSALVSHKMCRIFFQDCSALLLELRGSQAQKFSMGRTLREMRQAGLSCSENCADHKCNKHKALPPRSWDSSFPSSP